VVVEVSRLLSRRLVHRKKDCDMAQAASPNRTASGTVPWHATLQVSRVLVDLVEEVTYDQGRFLKRTRGVIVGREVDPTELDRAGQEQLLSELQDERRRQPSGVDLKALDAFIDVLAAAVPDR
jgi:hypothetical protein